MTLTQPETLTDVQAVTPSGRGRPAIAVLLLVAAPVGWVYGLAQETRDLGLTAWWAFVVGAIIAAAAAVAFRESAGLRSRLWAVPLLVTAVVALSLGDFTAYLLEIDGRSPGNYSLGRPWEWNLLATAGLATLFGAMLGLVAALLSHTIRKATDRAGGD
jgi:hypothetical protein